MSSAIDATVVLGLAGKASQVFAEPDTYLSFPLAPIGLRATGLRAMVSDPLGPEGSRQLAEFSALVNEIPEAALWQPDGDRLWDVYGDVLAGVQLAEDPLSDAEAAEYDRAFAVLYTKDASGATVQSPAVVAYDQYRDRYLAALQEYNNRQLSASTSSDPAVQQQWQGEKALLQQRVQQAEQDWVALGNRAAVDAARHVLAELASQAPATVWQRYRRQFDPDTPEIFFRTSPEGSLFLPTGFAPSDVVETQWPVLAMSREEMRALAAQAPPDLSTRLGGSAGDSDVLRVSFEYSSVQVKRDWLVPEAFAARCWRFRDPSRVLSDGAVPPSGECTGYVDGLVLARRITVRRAAPDDGQRAPDTRRRLGFLPSSVATLTAPAPTTRVYTAAQLQKRMVLRQASEASTDAPTATAPLRAAPLLAARAAVAAPTASLPRPRNPRLTRPVPGGGVVRPLPPQLIQVPSRRHPVLPPPLIPPPPPREEVVEHSTGEDEVYVVAFLCRRLPASPNPDPALSWPQ